MEKLIKAAWRYRGFITTSVSNDFKSRLARSRFGTAWIVLQPMAQMLIFATILSNVLAARLEGVDNKYAYAVYLMSGIACWSMFADIVSRCVTVFIDNASLLKKIQFPRISLPLIVVVSSLVNNLALLLIIFVILPLLGVGFTLNLLWLPLLVALTVALAAGIGLMLGTLNVFARDVGQVVAVVLQFWFWVTPIVYPAHIVPAGFRITLDINPVVPLVTSYQNAILYGKPPVEGLFYTAVVAVSTLSISLFMVRRAAAEMVDAL